MSRRNRKMPKGDCGCKNHLGKRKVKYPDQDTAIKAILDKHLKHGPHATYPCPKMAGVFHVRSLIR